MKKIIAFLCVIAIVIGFANFFWFISEATQLGGDALNGYENNGKYFVCAHGKCKEVTETVWRINRLHAISVLITHPLALISMGYLLLQYFFPAMMYGEERKILKDKVSTVSKSRIVIEPTKCSGKIGWVSFRGPLLKVTIYDDGILFEPKFMPAFAVFDNEISNIEHKKTLFSNRIELSHLSKAVASPIVLYLSKDNKLTQKLIEFPRNGWPGIR